MSVPISNDVEKYKRIESRRRFYHLLWFALGYAVGGVVLLATINQFTYGFAFIPVLAFIFATIILTGMWSVFGPGSYLQRFCWSHAIGAIVIIGLGVGSLLQQMGNSGFDASDIFTATVVVLLAFPGISLAAQLPFWFFRLFFGWQLVVAGCEPQESITLRDVFVVTFLFAFSFAAPQMAVNVNPFASGFDPTRDYQEITQADGSVTFEEVIITDVAKIEERRRQNRREMSMGIAMGYAGAALYSFVFSLLSFPIAVMMFRSEKRESGCVWVAFYTLGWFLLSILLVGVLSRGVGVLVETSAYWGGWLAALAAALSFPMAASHARGFRLSSRRSHSKGRKLLQNESTIK